MKQIIYWHARYNLILIVVISITIYFHSHRMCLNGEIKENGTDGKWRWSEFHECAKLGQILKVPWLAQLKLLFNTLLHRTQMILREQSSPSLLLSISTDCRFCSLLTPTFIEIIKVACLQILYYRFIVQKYGAQGRS